MTKHTQGPWRHTDCGDRRHKVFAIMHDVEDGGSVAQVFAGFGAHFDWETSEANACLIASAPELLAMLKAVSDDLAAIGRHYDPCAVEPCSCGLVAIRSRVCAAIAKAEGRTP